MNKISGSQISKTVRISSRETKSWRVTVFQSRLLNKRHYNWLSFIINLLELCHASLWRDFVLSCKQTTPQRCVLQSIITGNFTSLTTLVHCIGLQLFHMVCRKDGTVTDALWGWLNTDCTDSFGSIASLYNLLMVSFFWQRSRKKTGFSWFANIRDGQSSGVSFLLLYKYYPRSLGSTAQLLWGSSVTFSLFCVCEPKCCV